MEIVSLLPGMIVGPNLNKGEFMSGNFMKGIVTGSTPSMPRVSTPWIDVRDCAQAHLNAVLIPAAAN